VTSNRPLNVPPNRLAGESLPNTLGGIVLPSTANPLRRTWGATVLLAGAVLAVLAFVLLIWRPA